MQDAPLVTLEDFVEFTKWTRKEHDMRGYEAHDLVGKDDITERDIAPYIYPSDEDIAKNDTRGIYLSNFFYWDALAQCKQMTEKWNFGSITYKRERTFNIHGKIEDHANEVHDYLRYLKFGYGRATDDATTEVRHGRMTREEAVEMVKEYDSTTPLSLEVYCDFFEITVDEFYKNVEPMRDENIWEKKNGVWSVKDSIHLHNVGEKEEKARVEQSTDRTFSEENRQYYYNPELKPEKTGEAALDIPSKKFKVH